MPPRNNHFPHYNCLANCFATARDAKAEPDPECCEEDRDQRAIKLNGVLDDDEAVFGVLERSDKEPADQTEDENVAFHDGIEKEYIPAWPRSGDAAQFRWTRTRHLCLEVRRSF